LSAFNENLQSTDDKRRGGREHDLRGSEIQSLGLFESSRALGIAV